MTAIINSVKAREILDSRGKPTIEVDLSVLDSAGKSFMGRASIPSGASIGAMEAFELRDKEYTRYMGHGVLYAIDNVNNKISKLILGQTLKSQKKLDDILLELDGTHNKSHLGANAILGVSSAFARAVAHMRNQYLFEYLGQLFNEDDENIEYHYTNIPKKEIFINNINQLKPMVNVINGGQHADNKLDFQEFMIIPVEGTCIKNRIQISSEIFMVLSEELVRSGYNTNVGDEGGFAPNLKSAEEVLDLICVAVAKAGYENKIMLALDAAANTFYDGKKYIMKCHNAKYSSDEMIKYYEKLISEYPIVSIEDPLSEHDEEGWKNITKVLGKKIQLVGDDLFVTNPKIISSGINNAIANAVLIKLNQIGTITEAINAVKIARNHKYNTVISHRSGETEDTIISHIAVAFGSEYIKAGSMCRTDRISKYNELLRIHEILHD